MSELRVAVVGVSGAGKSSFSQALRSETQLPYLELDGLYHQPDWTPSPPEVMRTAVFEFMQTHGSWVIDGNYGIVRSAIWAKATHVVWLDLPKRMIVQRLLKRSVRRIATKEALWNDNREGLGALFSSDVDTNVWLNAWQRHGELQRQYSGDCLDPKWNHLRFVRVRSASQVQGTVDALSREYQKRRCA